MDSPCHAGAWNRLCMCLCPPSPSTPPPPPQRYNQLSGPLPWKVGNPTTLMLGYNTFTNTITFANTFGNAITNTFGNPIYI